MKLNDAIPSKPVSIEGKTFLSDVIDEVAQRIGMKRGEVAWNTDIEWASSECDHPVLDIDLLASSFVFVAPHYVWIWETLEDIVHKKSAGNVTYDIDFEEMYQEVTTDFYLRQKGLYDKCVDFTTIDKTAEWIVEDAIKHCLSQ